MITDCQLEQYRTISNNIVASRFFLKPPPSIIGHEDTIIIPWGAERVDYEGEMALVIKDRRNTAKSQPKIG